MKFYLLKHTMSATSSTLFCTYCKSDGHDKWNCPILMKKNKNKRQLKTWNRLITTWAHDQEALQGLYDKGDEAYGPGFRDYMDSIQIDVKLKEAQPNETPISSGMFQALPLDKGNPTWVTKGF